MRKKTMIEEKVCKKEKREKEKVEKGEKKKIGKWVVRV